MVGEGIGGRGGFENQAGGELRGVRFGCWVGFAGLAFLT